MQRFLLTFLCLLILAAIISTLYFYRAGVLLPSSGKVPSGGNYMLSAEFEEKMVYFLVTKLNIFEGNFEVIDVVNLNARNFTGNDYILITLRTPDGRFCQVMAKRQIGKSTEWQFDEQSFNVVGLDKYEPSSMEEYYNRLNELNIGFRKDDDGQSLVLLEKSSQDMPELLVFENIPSALSLEINKNKKIGLSNQMSEGGGPDVLWKPDYPTSYLGPGYRAYLYQKVKGRR